MRAETKKAWRNVIDTFTGADGGVRFVRVMGLIEGFDKAADKDADAQKVIEILWRFSKLIDVAQTVPSSRDDGGML